MSSNQYGEQEVDIAALQGPVAIASINGAGTAAYNLSATCNASADNIITFSEQVRKVQLCNLSATAIPYEHDAVATAASPALPAGASIYVDVHTTSLHVFPGSALPINAASGLIIRGYA